MKYGNQTVFVCTVKGVDGKDYGLDIIADDVASLEACFAAASIPATVDGELGIIVSKLDEATAEEITEVLNAQAESKKQRNH